MENPALEVSEQRICLFCGTWHPYGSLHRDEVPGGDGDVLPCSEWFIYAPVAGGQIEMVAFVATMVGD